MTLTPENALLLQAGSLWLAALMALAGLVVGSFIALLTVRLPLDEPVLAGRSRCRSCDCPLRPLDLIPVVSWLGLAGRCRACRFPISIRYPLIELACAFLGAWAVCLEPSWIGISGAVLAWGLTVVAVVDAEHLWLPDVFTIPLGAAGVLAAAIVERDELTARMIGAAVGFLALWLLAALYRRRRGREGLGGGDPLLAGAVGAWVGWAALPTVFVWTGALGLLWVLALRVRGRTVKGSDRLPFGTFMAGGAWLTWVFGPIGGG